jgi:hypothetical protein
MADNKEYAVNSSVSVTVNGNDEPTTSGSAPAPPEYSAVCHEISVVKVTGSIGE